jgi:hypothetical protein
MARKPKTFNARCTVCRHPDRQRIEMSHVAGVSLSAIAAKFDSPQHGGKRDAIARHCRDHLDEAARAGYLSDIPIKELAARAADAGVSLLSYFGLVWSTVLQQMLVASGVNDGHRTAVLAGRAVEVLREIGRLSGELGGMATSLTVNNNTVIMNSPIFVDLQAMLIAKLADFPEALNRVIEGLRELEEKDGGAPLALPMPFFVPGGVHVAA